MTIIASVKRGDLKPGDDIVISPLSQPTVGTEVTIYDPDATENAGKTNTDETASDEADKSKAN